MQENSALKQQNGFTLVELAIALMVIGLLIGGVLKGQELIENAKVTSFIRQIKAYDAATLIFRNTYGALPGDIKRPNRIPNCTEEICNIGGNGNGKIYNSDTSTSGIEIFNFFPHLTKAGMIQGPEGGASTSDNSDLFLPSTAFGLPVDVHADRGNFKFGSPHEDGITANAYELPAPHASSSSILPVRIMSAIDTKMDDGKPHSGDVQVVIYGDCPTIAYIEGNEENEYAADDTTNTYCPLGIRAGF